MQNKTITHSVVVGVFFLAMLGMIFPMDFNHYDGGAVEKIHALFPRDQPSTADTGVDNSTAWRLLCLN